MRNKLAAVTGVVGLIAVFWSAILLDWLGMFCSLVVLVIANQIAE